MCWDNTINCPSVNHTHLARDTIMHKLYAVKFVLTFVATGETVERVYVREHNRMSKATFTAWAYGDLVLMWTTNSDTVTTHKVLITDGVWRDNAFHAE